MRPTGTAHLPLHGGKAPSWLFNRMVRLAKEILVLLVEDYGSEEVLRRFADPFWFQALGCLLGFDWHSSGVTTTVTGAVKEALRNLGSELGLFVAGGKGKASRRTPHEVEEAGERTGFDPAPLVYASRMAAKVDTTALQDGYPLYHHVIIFIPQGRWAVVQQGMNKATRYARRYHWLSEGLSSFVEEPHKAVCAMAKGKALNMVARESDRVREGVVELVKEYSPDKLEREMKKLQELDMPPHHAILLRDIRVERLRKGLMEAYQQAPSHFQGLLEIPGMGPKTLRALALTAEVLYGTPVSFRDPARFAFAHGGKDGHPYPVDKGLYDATIEMLRQAVKRARLSPKEKNGAQRRLETL
jgi:hypothetical protein